MALAPGTRLGAYEILSMIGSGGMGEVYKARDTRLERTVALKVLASALVGDPEFRDRFEREARTISQLTHPHICVLHDIGDAVVSAPSPLSSGTSPQRQLVWVDRQGREEPLSAPLRAYAIPRISPDGTRVAVDARDEEYDIWVWDLARGTLRRLTSDPGLDVSPVWTPDSHGILFSSVRGGGMPNMYRQAADGTGATEALPKQSGGLVLTSIAPDGMRAVGAAPTGPTNIVVMTLGEKPHVDPLLQSKFVTRNAEIAPDGRWVAYESNESGRAQIYVRPFPNVETGSWPVSTQGGTRPMWAPSGRELFYIDADGYLTSVPVQIVTTFSAGNPARVFQNRYFSGTGGRTYDVSRDGQKFLMVKDVTASGSTPPPSMVIVLNWVDELKAKLQMKP